MTNAAYKPASEFVVGPWQAVLEAMLNHAAVVTLCAMFHEYRQDAGAGIDATRNSDVTGFGAESGSAVGGSGICTRTETYLEAKIVDIVTMLSSRATCDANILS